MQDRGWRNIFIAAVWLVLWYGLDRLIGNEILFAGPAATMRSLMRLLGTSEFYISVVSTLLRIAAGFAAGAAVGIAAAVLGYRVRAVGAFLAPFVTVLKSTPVVSFVILLLIWAGNKNLSLLICLLVVAPILYLNTMSGLCAVDIKLLEMARILHIPYRSRIRYIYIPQLRPSLASALSLSLGMSWKSGVAAEVIGQPLHTIGNALYRSKIFFETADVFAWTLVIIAMSWAFERAVGKLLAGLDVLPGGGSSGAGQGVAVVAEGDDTDLVEADVAGATADARGATVETNYDIEIDASPDADADEIEKANADMPVCCGGILPRGSARNVREHEMSSICGQSTEEIKEIKEIKDIKDIKDDSLYKRNTCTPHPAARIELRSITKSYDGKTVLQGFTAVLEAGGAYLLTGPSGSGKTTLLRILLGRESADEGGVVYNASAGCISKEKKHDGKTGYAGETGRGGETVYNEKTIQGRKIRYAGEIGYGTDMPVSAGVVFQEDRLCEEFSAIDNVAMIFKKPDIDNIRRELSLLLPADELDKPVCELSGGMRRRVCIVRACMKPSELLAMDEPFNGLDAATRDRCISYIRSRQASRTLLIVSHSTHGLEFCRRMSI